MYRSKGFIEPDPVCLRPKVRMREPPESTGDVRISGGCNCIAATPSPTTTMDEEGRHLVHNTVERAVWMVSLRRRRRCVSRTVRFFTIFLRKSNAARRSDAGRLPWTQHP